MHILQERWNVRKATFFIYLRSRNFLVTNYVTIFQLHITHHILSIWSMKKYSTHAVPDTGNFTWQALNVAFLSMCSHITLGSNLISWNTQNSYITKTKKVQQTISQRCSCILEDSKSNKNIVALKDTHLTLQNQI